MTSARRRNGAGNPPGTAVRYVTAAEMAALPPGEARRAGRDMARRLAAAWSAGYLSGEDLAEAVTTVWWQSLHPTAWLPARTWAAMFAEIGYRAGGSPAGRPAGPVTLYRGVAACRTARRLAVKYTGLPPELGWHWTRDPDLAETFARARAAPGTAYAGPWTVSRIEAPPAALLALIADHRGEREHVVNTSALTTAPVVVRASGAPGERTALVTARPVRDGYIIS